MSQGKCGAANILLLSLAIFVSACNPSSPAAPTSPGGNLTPPESGGCPPPPTVQVTQPSFPLKLTMAEKTQGDAFEPVNPTTVFKSNSVFHAVVRIESAPPASKFGAVWYSLDTGGVAACNSAIDATALEADGSRNLDFSLPANGKWPVGTYQVQIVVNGKIAVVQNFSVK